MHGHLDVIYFNSKISDRTRVYMCVYIYIYISYVPSCPQPQNHATSYEAL